MVWSPASCSTSIRQSIHASTSRMIGEPVAPASHPTPRNLSAPLVAKSRQTSSCSAERMFTAKAPLLRMRGHDEEVVAGQNRISGGSRDTDENDWQVSEERRVGKKRRARGWTKH